MDAGPPPSSGLLGSFRKLGEGLLASLEDRISLVSLELKEEKLRLIRTLFWIGAILFSGVMAATFASLTVVYLLWETSRLMALGGLALLYSATFACLIAAFRRYLESQPKPLAATLEEIGEDRECIRARN